MRRANTWLTPSANTSPHTTSALPSAATATFGRSAPAPAARAGSTSTGADRLPRVGVGQPRGAHVAALRPDRVGDAVDAHLHRQALGAAAADSGERARRPASRTTMPSWIHAPRAGRARRRRPPPPWSRPRSAPPARPTRGAQLRQPGARVLDVDETAALLDAEVDDRRAPAPSTASAGNQRASAAGTAARASEAASRTARRGGPGGGERGRMLRRRPPRAASSRNSAAARSASRVRQHLGHRPRDALAGSRLAQPRVRASRVRRSSTSPTVRACSWRAA